MKFLTVIISFTIPFLYFLCSNAQDITDSGKDTLGHTSKENNIDNNIQNYEFVKSIPTPEGFERISAKKNSYQEYLRNLKLKTENNEVLLYDGTLKRNQSAQFVVIKMDVGKRDLQQCSDAIMRMRGEYLFAQKRFNEIHFNFLSDGKPRYFITYAKNDRSYKKFRKYMDYIFSYANTSSFKNELKKVKNISEIEIGDIFIQKGVPYGHAITVMDIAVNKINGGLIFMLSQSYMPAQEIHILKNPGNKSLSPWYLLKKTNQLYTPEWTFKWDDLMRF